MLAMQISVIFILIVFGKTVSSRDTSFQSPLWSPQPDVCKPGPKGRVPWILHVRDSDYGWREHTHRAMIALAVYEYKGDDYEMKKMSLQLEIELTRALFRNRTSRIHDSDLALYIHALLATNKNPRNFHGVDLVADLLHRVHSADGTVNPFLVLALCNAHVIEYEHLNLISKIANLTHFQPGFYDASNHPDVDSRVAQLKALTFKALACAARYDPRQAKFSSEMTTIINCLHRKYNQEDGSFGNVYTTSLAVQAFSVVPRPPTWWDERKSLAYLEKESEIDVNLIKAYYIEMALNARKYQFIRELYEGVPTPGIPEIKSDTIDVHYTIKESDRPGMYFTLTMNVAKGTSFYEVMEMASNASPKFKFTAYQNNDGDQMVYSVAGIPNDVEENMFWRLCRKNDEDNRYRANTTYFHSPSRLVPKHGEHFMYLYRNVECPQ